MIEFKPITIKDKEIITSYTLPSTIQDSSFSFANLCCWHFLNESSYAIVNNFLIFRFRFKGGVTYSIPLGKPQNQMPLIVEQLKNQTKGPFRLIGVFPEIKEQLEKYFYSTFDYFHSRDHFDYIYLRKHLAELKGANYQAKRNHINKFENKYQYEYLPITPELIPECMALYNKWCVQRNCKAHESLENERKAITFAMEHFQALDLSGGAIRINGEIVAFTYGAPINNETFAIHIEKADTYVHGAYAAINQHFASRIPVKFRYINREEDMGVPGLRKAKLSYYPNILLEKCIAELKS